MPGKGDEAGASDLNTSAPPVVQPTAASPSASVYREVTLTRTTSPYPLPEMLEMYNRALPNGAERVMALAEGEAAHRRMIETTLVGAHVGDSRRGFWGALAIVAAFFALAVWCLATGRSVGGVAALLIPLSYLAGTFIHRMSVHQSAKQGREGKP